MAFIVLNKEGKILSVVNTEFTPQNVQYELETNLIPNTQLGVDEFKVLGITAEEANSIIEEVIFDEEGEPIGVKVSPYDPSSDRIIFDDIDPEKLAMAEAIIAHEVEIQQLKAELAALKGE